MQRKLHVRFGERTAETHPAKARQGAAAYHCAYVSSWSGSAYTAFVMDGAPSLSAAAPVFHDEN